MSKKSTEKNPKIRAISAIWGFATGMLGICVPLVAITESGVTLPIAVILGATGTSAVVWSSSRSQDDEDLDRSVQQLHERVINLELIASSSDIDLQKQFQELESSVQRSR